MTTSLLMEFVLAHSEDGFGRAGIGASDADIVPGVRRRATNEFESLAVSMHAQSRRRADLFSNPVMADYPLDLMLTALIAHEQGTALSRRAAAMANRMDFAAADAVIAQLIEARLIEPHQERDPIRLSEHGADLMRKYLRACNDQI
jgi:hypothetical protein